MFWYIIWSCSLTYWKKTLAILLSPIHLDLYNACNITHLSYLLWCVRKREFLEVIYVIVKLYFHFPLVEYALHCYFLRMITCKLIEYFIKSIFFDTWGDQSAIKRMAKNITMWYLVLKMHVEKGQLCRREFSSWTRDK
jgi:hypothetical protein